MRFSKPILIAAVATMAMVVSAGAAMAHINASTREYDCPRLRTATAVPGR